MKPQDKCLRSMQFLGCHQLLHMIPHSSHVSIDLTALSKKGAKFKWTLNCQAAFDTLKLELTRQVKLNYPDFTNPFEIYTDAFKLQLVAVISQENHPLAFYSRKLSDAQTRYTFIELELLSIMETLQEFCSILLGNPINIYTDHKNLTFNNFTTYRVHFWRLIVE